MEDWMVKIMIAPNRYVQGPGVLGETGKHIGHLGSKVFFVAGPVAWSIVKEQIESSLAGSSMTYRYEGFTGLCTQEAVARLSEKARAFSPDVVAGVGGGAAIDT